MLPLRPALRLPLLAAALVAANLAYADVPASAPFTPEQHTALQQLVASQVRAATPAMASAAAAAVEDKTRNIETAKEVLEVGRNQLNFWLAFLGVLTACIGLFGIVVPFFTVRNYKAEIDKQAEALRTQLALAETAVASSKGAQEKAEAAQQQTEAALKHVTAAQENIATAQVVVGKAQQETESLQTRVETVLASAKEAQEKAEQHAQQIETLLKDAREKTSLIPNAKQITGELSAEVLEKLRAEKPPQVVKLIKQAWDAQHREDWQAALPLWSLLSLIESQDSNVWFNLGVVHSEGHQNWIAAAECFERSNLLDSHSSTLFNWASCIYEQGAISKQEDKLREAIDKYREAYGLDENFSLAYFQRAVTLVELATWVSGSQKHLHFAEAQTDYENAIKHGFQVKRTVYEQLAQLMTLWADSLAEPERQEKLDAADNYRKQAGQAL